MRNVFFILLSLIAHHGMGQSKMGYWLTSKVVRIPFEIVNNSIVLQVKLNHYENLSFIVDTGSIHSAVFTDQIVRINVQQKSIAILGFGSTDSLFAKVSVGNSLSIGGLVSQGKQLLAIEKNQVKLQQFFDRPIHGIIGLDMLRHYDMKINFNAKRIILQRNSVKVKTSPKWKKLPFELQETALVVPATITKTEGANVSVSILLDTGSDLPLLLQERFCPPRSRPVIIGMGILGYTFGRIGVVKKVTLGDLEIDNIMTAFPDSTSSKWNSSLTQQGNLGIQLLRRYRVIVNYGEKYLQLRPSGKSASAPFPYNRTGIAVEAHEQEKCSYYISQIAPGSPAEASGLKTGDQLIHINKTQCSSLSFESINRHFFDTKASRLEIGVQREGSLITFRLDLPPL